MTGFAGTGQLTRLAFRRDVVVLPVCVFWIAALLAITARDLKVLYPTAGRAVAGAGSPAGGVGCLVAAAFALAAWRDHSAGLLPGRPGRPAASGLLRGPSGLAWRLQRGVLAAWLAGYVLVFAACGAAATGVGSILGASAELRRYLLREGYQATLIHAYLSALMLLAGLAAAVYATSAVLGLRAEETGNLAEPVLATATGRIRWGLSHIWVAAGGACLLLAAAGLSAGLGYGILTGSVSTQVSQLLGAALARLPAVLVLAAVAILLFGLLPWESTALAWSAVALAGVIAVFGPPLQWPAWMMDISPFTQTPKLPGGTVSAEPLLWLCGIALALTVVGLAGLRRRDLGDLGPSRLTGSVLNRLADYVQESNQITPASGGTAKPPANH